MINAIGIHIKVANFERSKTFYEALGFQKTFEYGPAKQFEKDETGNLVSAPEAYQGVTFKHGWCRLEIADGHRAVKPEVFKERVAGPKISVMIDVDDLSEILKRCKKNRISVATSPRHYYWGTLEMVVRDPDGVVLVFIAPYSREKAKKLGADERFGVPPAS